MGLGGWGRGNLPPSGVHKVPRTASSGVPLYGCQLHKKGVWLSPSSPLWAKAWSWVRGEVMSHCTGWETEVPLAAPAPAPLLEGLLPWWVLLPAPGFWGRVSTLGAALHWDRGAGAYRPCAMLMSSVYARGMCSGPWPAWNQCQEPFCLAWDSTGCGCPPSCQGRRAGSSPRARLHALDRAHCSSSEVTRMSSRQTRLSCGRGCCLCAQQAWGEGKCWGGSRRAQGGVPRRWQDLGASAVLSRALPTEHPCFFIQCSVSGSSAAPCPAEPVEV